MSLSHMIILGIIALIVIPPEKLPEMAKQLAKFIFEIKRSADQVLGDLKREAMIKPEDILDKNIKEKLEELQRGLHQPINLDSLVTKPKPAAAPAEKDAAAQSETHTNTDDPNQKTVKKQS